MHFVITPLRHLIQPPVTTPPLFIQPQVITHLIQPQVITHLLKGQITPHPNITHPTQPLIIQRRHILHLPTIPPVGLILHLTIARDRVIHHPLQLILHPEHTIVHILHRVITILHRGPLMQHHLMLIPPREQIITAPIIHPAPPIRHLQVIRIRPPVPDTLLLRELTRKVPTILLPSGLMSIQLRAAGILILPRVMAIQPRVQVMVIQVQAHLTLIPPLALEVIHILRRVEFMVIQPRVQDILIQRRLLITILRPVRAVTTIQPLEAIPIQLLMGPLPMAHHQDRAIPIPHRVIPILPPDHTFHPPMAILPRRLIPRQPILTPNQHMLTHNPRIHIPNQHTHIPNQLIHIHRQHTHWVFQNKEAYLI